jgi:hypothetical protein
MLRLPLLLALGLAGCAGSSDGPAGSIPITGLDGGGDERALLYYAGGLAAPDGADPLATGLLIRSGTSDYALATGALPGDLVQRLLGDEPGRALDWKTEVKPAFEATYASARRLPTTVASLQEEVGVWGEDDPDWFVHEVYGVMTDARRRLFVRTDAAQQAAMAMASGGPAGYPVGTAIVGEHWMDGRLLETTVKRRRADGHWDFMVYDEAGTLTEGTTTPPRALAAPAKCIGCHLGQKLHPPEKAFPAAAPDGPAGPRAVHVPDAWREAVETESLASRFQEHARRADGVLGLYGTLYAARAVAQARNGGPLSAADSALVALLGP